MRFDFVLFWFHFIISFLFCFFFEGGGLGGRGGGGGRGASEPVCGYAELRFCDNKLRYVKKQITLRGLLELILRVCYLRLLTP